MEHQIDYYSEANMRLKEYAIKESKETVMDAGKFYNFLDGRLQKLPFSKGKALAEKANISLSTFREHLRKAEKRIMPNLIRNVKDEI